MPDDLLLYSLEIAGPGGHWVEFSRPLTRGEPNVDTSRMLEAYEDYHAVARTVMRPGASAHDVHRASRRHSAIAATRSATLPATRSG